MRILLLVLIAAASGCASSTPAPQPPVTPAPQGDPPPTAPAGEPLSEATLTAFVGSHFAAAVADGTVTLNYGSAGVASDLLVELAAMSITDTVGLAAIVPGDFATRGIDAIRATGQTTNVPGLVRDLLIIHDVRGYFTRAWNNAWAATGPGDFPAPAAYGVDFAVMEELGVFGGEGDYGGASYGGATYGGGLMD